MNELTREQILNMSAQELAEATAVHVMGWEIISQNEDMRRFQTADYPAGQGIIALYGKRYVARSGGRRIDWNPAEDIAVAWEVEDKIKELSGGEKGLIIKYMTRLMNVVGEDGFDMLHATPEQRCKAALLAVMGL